MADESTIVRGGNLGEMTNRHLSNPDALEANQDRSVLDYALSDLRLGALVLWNGNPDVDKYVVCNGAALDHNDYPLLPPAYGFTEEVITEQFYTGLAWGNGVFVAVSNTNTTTQTSPDGETWTPRAAAIPSLNLNYRCLAFGAGLFVLVYTDVCYTSPDGITWTSRTIPAGVWLHVNYVNGVFVAIGTNICATSTDGITWVSRTMPAGTYYDCAYGAGLIVAIGNAGVCATSPDGITWTGRTALPAPAFCIAYGSGIFVAGGAGGDVFSSVDGIAWVQQPDLGAEDFSDIAHNGVSFCLPNECGTQMYVSNDGLVWNAITVAEICANCIAADDSGVFAIIATEGTVSLLGALTAPNISPTGQWAYWLKVA